MKLWEILASVALAICAGIVVIFVFLLSMLPYAAVTVLLLVGARYLGWF